MKQKYGIRLMLALAVVCLTKVASSAGVETPGADNEQLRGEQIVYLGQDAFERQRYTDAQRLFVLAYKRGAFSVDSLYYLLARVHMYKGSLDSSLAYNAAFRAKRRSALRIKQLEQRSAIYRLLGWEDERLRVVDTLQNERLASRRAIAFAALLPQMYLTGTIGSRYLRERAAAAPFEGGEQYAVLDPFGPKLAWDARGRLTWRFGLPHGRLKLAAGAAARKNHRLDVPRDSDRYLDSLISGLEKSGQASLAWENILNAVSLQADIGYSTTYLRRANTTASIGLTHHSLGKEWSRYVSAAYAHSLRYNEQSGSCYASFDPTYVRPHGFVFSFQGLWLDNASISYATSVDLIEFDTGVLESGGKYRMITVPRLDDAGWAQADTSGPVQWMEVAEIAHDPSDLLVLDQPLRYLSLAPEIGYRVRAGSWLWLRASVGWQLDYYLQDTRWATLLNASPQDVVERYADSGWISIVYEEQSESYYWLGPGGELVPALDVHRKRRVDHTPSLHCGVELNTPLGVFSLNMDLGKTFSNLQGLNPTELDDINLKLYSSWSKLFGKR